MVVIVSVALNLFQGPARDKFFFWILKQVEYDGKIVVFVVVVSLLILKGLFHFFFLLKF